MSASVATPVAGLSHDIDPGNTHDFAATDFSDRMEVDRLEDSQPNNRKNTEEATPGQDASQESTAEDRNRAVGNLLAALSSNNAADQSGDSTDLTTDQTADPPIYETNNQLSDALAENNTLINASRLPSFDPIAANSGFDNQDLNFTQNGDIPRTPTRSSMPQVYGNMDPPPNGIDTTEGDVDAATPVPVRKKYEAFARLVFPDGNFYLNTYSCELGRDVLAYKAALQREEEAKEAALNEPNQTHSSSGKASRMSDRVRIHGGSQVQGSVVSEAGGFAGIDDQNGDQRQNRDEAPHSSQASESSVVKPQEVLINPRLIPFDYKKSAEIQAQFSQLERGDVPDDDEQPAAVTLDHMPDPNLCPLIPIHATMQTDLSEVESHKKISRRHVKLFWNFDKDQWEMKVMGRNGAFLNDVWHRIGTVLRLSDESRIQISHVQLTFRLPITPDDPDEDEEVDESQLGADAEDADEVIPSIERRPSETLADDGRPSFADSKTTPKISLNLKIGQKSDTAQPSELPIGPDGFPIMPKKRGPGRPPKDGIMSTRERKEREKAAKMAAAREANGGRTPPPMIRGKITKPQNSPEESPKIELPPEKRKYKKRKRVDENGEPLPDAEGSDIGSDEDKKAKKARAQREKSKSPDYPAREALTAEQLTRPQEPYAILLYKVLMDVYPRELPLKDIYRELKMRYPYFIYEVGTEGWQSSVRHNLNSEWKKYFEKGDKEGKGFAWRAIPGVALPAAEKKRTTTQQATPKPKPPQAKPPFPPGPGQPIHWQNNGYPPPNPGQAPFINHGPWPMQGPPNGQNWPPSGPTPPPPNGTLPGIHAPGIQQMIQPNSQQTTQPPGVLPQGSSHPPQPNVAQQLGQPPNDTGQQSLPPPPPPPPLAPSSSSSAPSNMPCTLDGVLAIRRFETAMYDQISSSPSKKAHWQAVFKSAKNRLLHGHPESSLPSGETKEEQTIMSHIAKFVHMYRNPNFKGFRNVPAPQQSKSRTASPTAVIGVAQNSNGSGLEVRSVVGNIPATPNVPPTNASPTPAMNGAHTAASSSPVVEEQNDVQSVGSAPTAVEVTSVQNGNTEQSRTTESTSTAAS